MDGAVGVPAVSALPSQTVQPELYAAFGCAAGLRRRSNWRRAAFAAYAGRCRRREDASNATTTRTLIRATPVCFCRMAGQLSGRDAPSCGASISSGHGVVRSSGVKRKRMSRGSRSASFHSGRHSPDA